MDFIKTSVYIKMCQPLKIQNEKGGVGVPRSGDLIIVLVGEIVDLVACNSILDEAFFRRSFNVD